MRTFEERERLQVGAEGGDTVGACGETKRATKAALTRLPVRQQGMTKQLFLQSARFRTSRGRAHQDAWAPDLLFFFPPKVLEGAWDYPQPGP